MQPKIHATEEAEGESIAAEGLHGSHSSIPNAAGSIGQFLMNKAFSQHQAPVSPNQQAHNSNPSSIDKPANEEKKEPELEPEPEPEQKEEPEEEEENRKLIIGNWPSGMGDTLLSTLFSPYGQLLEAKIVNDCGIIEYDNQASAQTALNKMNGFQMGPGKLVVTFASNEISHILQMENDGVDHDNKSDSAQEEPDPGPEPEPEPEPVSKPKPEPEPEAVRGPEDPSIIHYGQVGIIPNQNKIEEKEDSQMKHISKEEHKQQSVDKQESSSESDLSYSDSSDIDSTDSQIERKIKATASKKKLTKKQLRKLKRKEKKKRRRKLKKKKSRAVRKREKYDDNNINALHECLNKFTDLMSSVSKSAMVMQQSVAQMSQLHAQQQQQSMLYQQSMRSVLPNQPMYTSIIPQSGQQQPQQPQQLQRDESGQKQQDNRILPDEPLIKSIVLNNPNDNVDKKEEPIQNQQHARSLMIRVNPDMMNQQLLDRQFQLIQSQSLHINQLRQQQLINNATSIIPQMGHQQPQHRGPGQERYGRAQGQNISQTMQNVINQISNTPGGRDNDDGNVAAPKMNTDIINEQFLSQQNQLIQAQELQRAQMRQPLKDNNAKQIDNTSAPKSPIPEDTESKLEDEDLENKLDELQSKGYENKDLNLQLLKAANGNVLKVIESLKKLYSEI